MTEIDNSLSEWLFAIKKDSPGKTWWNAQSLHDATYRALRIDRTEFGANYAAHPFRLARVDAKAVVLAALPAPKLFDGPDLDWLAIETVIAWDPVHDTASVLGDPAPQIVGALSDDANALFASPRTFFQGWAVRRAQFAMQRSQARTKSWHAIPKERDETPGALLIGELGKVQLRPTEMPEHIETVGIDPRELNKAIMRAARLPRATARPTDLRRAA